MPDEKETEQQIPDMSQIEDVDDVIKVPFRVPPEGEEVTVYENEGKVINYASIIRARSYGMPCV